MSRRHFSHHREPTVAAHASRVQWPQMATPWARTGVKAEFHHEQVAQQSMGGNTDVICIRASVSGIYAQ